MYFSNLDIYFHTCLTLHVGSYYSLDYGGTLKQSWEHISTLLFKDKLEAVQSSLAFFFRCMEELKKMWNNFFNSLYSYEKN